MYVFGGSGLSSIHSLPKCIKGIRLVTYVIFIYSKYARYSPLKYQKDDTTVTKFTNVFKLNRRPNKM